MLGVQMESRLSRLLAGGGAVLSAIVASAWLISHLGVFTDGHSAVPVFPEPAGLGSYERRCARLNAQGARARVLYEPRTKMSRGRSDLVTAAVTLDQRAPPDQILKRPGAAEEPGVVVSCRIQAKLRSAPHVFELDPNGWVARSLLTVDTTRWSWYVTPKVGGTHTLVLLIRPIVRARPVGSAEPVSVSEVESDVQEYETRVHVSVPWTERPQETMSRLAATFNVAESLVKSFTALVLAALALLAALGIRRRRRNSEQPAPPS
jgi:hypothetical protein